MEITAFSYFNQKLFQRKLNITINFLPVKPIFKERKLKVAMRVSVSGIINSIIRNE